jgi:hypothetical protein
LRFKAQAESFGEENQSIELSPTPAPPQSPQDLQELVVPIALYPDARVAQALAASAYPTDIVEVDRYVSCSPKIVNRNSFSRGEAFHGSGGRQ